MTEDEALEVCSRLSGELMTHSGLNIETREWHAILEFLAKSDSGLADFRALLDYQSTQRKLYKQGAFTPQGKVHCVDCLGQKDASLKPIEDGYGITRCMQCGGEMVCRGEVADLNNLRLDLPRGWYPRLEQTGGMTCNLYMDVVGHEYMVSVLDESHYAKFTMDWFPDSVNNDDSHHVGLFGTADEIVMAVTKYRFKYGVRVQ